MEEQESIATDISYYPPGCIDIDNRQIALGLDRAIIIEPVVDAADDTLSMRISISGIDPATSAWVMVLLGSTLAEEYGTPEHQEEGTA